jgi:hypothetical protein
MPHLYLQRTYKMVNIKKIRWIPILMVFSQVLLAGFVAYWLMSQYNDEKNILHEDLNRIYEESRNQVIDSLLFSRVVEPALNDSVTITLSSGEKLDTAGHKVYKTFNSNILTGKRDSFCTPTIVTVSIPDSLAGKRIRSGSAFAFSNSKQDFLIRSVKLFINHSGDSAAGKSELPGFLPGNPDTALFKKVYSEKLDAKISGVTVIWNPDTGKNARETEDVEAITNVKIVKNQKNSGVHYTSVLPDNFPRVEIRHQFPYLIGRISPQILFALILLLLTGSAFFFTNRSLKRQLILNSLRNDFVSNITHELRTPVSTVKVAIEALKTFDKVSNPEITRDYLDMAGQEMNRLDELIGKVLDQSLIDEQKEVIQPQPSDLKDLTDKVLLTLQPRIADRNARVVFDARPRPNPPWLIRCIFKVL